MKLVRTLVPIVGAVALAAFGAAPASADPPPAAAGTTSHGLLIDHGVVTPIDHPDAATVPRTPDGQTGTGTLGVNDRGEVLGVYEGRDRIVRHFVRDRKGRFAIIDDPPGTRGDVLSYEAVDITTAGRSSASTTTSRGPRRPASCAQGRGGSRTSPSRAHA
jgi:hypothetical protein